MAQSMAPWPDQYCPHPDCGRHIRDLLAEMVPDQEQRKAEFKALVGQIPGGAITCPYCQGAVEYSSDGITLAISGTAPFRYSRTKMEMRAKDFGLQKTPPDLHMTPERWITEEKLMPGALHKYRYAEDPVP
jgi:hypothetical protein